MERQTSAAMAVDQIVRAYDKECVRALSEKQYLSRILCGVLDEYAGLTPEEVEAECLVGEPVLGEPVGRDERAAGRVRRLSSEDKTVAENTATFDLRFESKVPGAGGRTLIDVNVEAQRKFNEGYPLTKRAVYYCGRLLSMQGEGRVRKSHYEKVRKVVSIWVCTNPDRGHRGTVDRFRLAHVHLAGEVEYAREDWDLVEVVLICLDDRNPEGHGGVLGMLGTLLSEQLGPEEKKRRLCEDYGIIMSETTEERVRTMCNLGEGIYEDAFEEGIEEGKMNNLLKNLRSLMETLQVDAPKAMDLLQVPVADRAELVALL